MKTFQALSTLGGALICHSILMIVNVGEILNRHDTCSLKIVIFKLSSTPDSDLIIAKGNDLIWTNYCTRDRDK